MIEEKNNVKIDDRNGNSTKPLLSSRLLKFRAWVRNEIMVNVVSIDFNNEFITWDDNQYDRCVPPNKCFEIETFDDIVLMQNTGLTDKNGKEIYEGDFILGKTFSNKENKSFVVFDLDYGCFQLQTFGNKPLSFPIKSFNKELEVIGNIFENPELL